MTHSTYAGKHLDKNVLKIISHQSIKTEKIIRKNHMKREPVDNSPFAV